LLTLAPAVVPYLLETKATPPGLRRSRPSERITREAATEAPIPTAAISRINRIVIRSANQFEPNPPAFVGAARAISGPVAADPAHFDASRWNPTACAYDARRKYPPTTAIEKITARGM